MRDAEGSEETADPGDLLDCEIHVPISPTPAFFNQVRLLAASFRRFGGPLRNSRIVVTVGGGERTDLATQLPWSREYGVEWRWLDPELFARHDYWGTAVERFREPFESKYVLFLDADVLAISPPELATSPVTQTGGIAGLIAHVAPFEASLKSLAGWTELTQAAGLGDPPLVARHSGWGLMDWDLERQYAPPYFNLGVLFCSSDAARALGSRDLRGDGNRRQRPRDGLSVPDRAHARHHPARHPVVRAPLAAQLSERPSLLARLSGGGRAHPADALSPGGRDQPDESTSRARTRCAPRLRGRWRTL